MGGVNYQTAYWYSKTKNELGNEPGRYRFVDKISL